LIFSVDKEFYNVLGIKQNANLNEIKSAYRSLTKQYHPDKNPSPDANDKFSKINNAYEVLSDPEKRKKYDLYGEKGLEENNSGGGMDPFDIFGYCKNN